MKKIAFIFPLCLALFFCSKDALGQKKPLPKKVEQVIQKIQPVKPLKKDTVYTAVTTPVKVSGRILTADELFLSSGNFAMRISNNYRYLTLLSPSPATGDMPRIWAFVDDPAQNLWKFIPQDEGFYKIQTQSGLFLEADYNNRLGHYELKTHSATSGRAIFQLWKLEDLTGGLFKITNKMGQVLSLSNTKGKDGDSLSLATISPERYEQKWHLIRMSNDGRRVTSFNPVVSGFRFINTFNGEDFIRWGGLCGGMVYSALDYFRTGMPVPTQSYTPANATTLQSYIYQRQQHSMWNVNEKWSEMEVAYNTRAGEIFRWGIQGSGGGRLEELKNAIDAGRSVPIGLFVGGVGGLDREQGGNHVMLAVGYSMGRYRGDFTSHPEDYKIFAYDPNEGNRLVTLVPNMSGQCYLEVENGKVWRAYFVNNKYDNDHVPPAGIPNFPEGEPEGSIRHLYAQFVTGGDDLRGGSDNVTVVVHYRDGTTQSFPNVNNGARWIDNSTQTVHLALNRAVRKSDISHFRLVASFGSDPSSEDWNLDWFRVTTGGEVLYLRRHIRPPAMLISAGFPGMKED